MAISSSADWSLASIGTCRKLHKFTFFPSCKTLHFVSAHSFNLPFFPLNSCGFPSPVLEDRSFNTPIVQLDLKFVDSQRFTVPDVDNLNSFLCELLRDPQGEEVAYEYYEKAKERPGFIPEKSMFKLLIRYLVQSRNWDLILSLSHDFRSYNVLPDSNTCSKLVTSCIRARKFGVVKALLEVFKSDEQISVLALDSAMEGYNKLHMFRSTISVYETMKSVGTVSDSRCFCRLMEAYQRLGDTKMVIALFNEFKSRNLDLTPTSSHVYGILCESLGKSGRAYEALEYFRDMKKKGILVNSSIYSSLISSFAGVRDVNVTEEIFREAFEKRMVRDPELYMKLVLMYVEEGQVEKTLEIVRAMRKAKVKVSDCVICTIVNAYLKRRGPMAAITVYEELILQGCRPGQVTYASIINAYYRAGLYSKAEMTFSEMEQKGFDKCVVAYSSMVAMYGKTGRLTDAMMLVAKMKQKGCKPNVWVYNALMDMHGRVRNVRKVEKLWKEMKRRKVEPDKVSYTTIISAYNKAREYEMCMKLYQEFRIKSGLIDKAMAGIMVGVFSKTGRIDELVKLLRDMKAEGTKLDGRLYHSALNGLRDAGLETQVQWLQNSFEANAS